jgi:transaldolase
MPPNPLRQLEALGQSVWLDFIERGFVRNGGLAKLIHEDGVSGVTSNPAIFHHAIAQGASYREAIDQRARAGLAAHEIHEALVIEDLRDAAAALHDVYRDSNGRDGYVSLEVSPLMARDADETYWEAKRLWALVNRPNLMIKVPGTVQGIAAIRRLTADGININVTLLFSVERYEAVAEAFIEGLSERSDRKLSLEPIASVASFFLSRIDALLDPKLDAAGTSEARALRGQCAIVCGRAAYSYNRQLLDTQRWRALQARGARPQRLLWASTGAKDPAYSDTKYVDALVYPDTVTTLPPATLVAYRDHGRPTTQPVDSQAADVSVKELARRLADAEIDWQATARQLEEEGIQKFIEPHEAIVASLRTRMAMLKG